MSKLEQAARQALEALEVSTDWDVGAKGKQLQSMRAITALREALAEQATVSDGLCGGCAKKAADGWALYCVECWEKAEQEPVAWMWRCKPYCDWPNWSVSIKRPVDSGCGDFPKTKGYEDIPLYAAPVRTKDLTDDEILKCDERSHGNTEWTKKKAFARAVIAADREKNQCC